jgi:two-component system, NtrC family, sensor kinase
VFDPGGASLDALSAPADSALLARPAVSVRMRISVAFALIFALCVAVTLWSMYAVSAIQQKIRFLELADSYTSEVQEARRYEKNFLLYGTAIEEALAHLDRADELLQQNLGDARQVLGNSTTGTMQRLAQGYRAELERLGREPNLGREPVVETELRRSGAQMVALAQQFRDKEREAVDRILTFARRVPVVFLGLVLAMMTFVGAFLARQIIGSLRRFTDYAARIGAGDFTPIIPIRKYRDEFSQLALALNRMVRELEHREQVLVETHKLRAIGTLVAGVAHELNNPLNNVMLTAAWLDEQKDEMPPSERQEMVKDIISQTERSQKIVRNLLDFARESETSIEPLDLGAIVDEAVQLVANQVRMRKVRLGVTLADNLPPVHGDRQLLCQVLVNLILNALDVLGPSGRIAVRTRRAEQDGFLAVDVSDDGPGIPPHILPQIFDPFFTTKPKGKGTGLGLSVSLGIVRKLGGTISVRSRAGEGATFSVLLPATSVPAGVGVKPAVRAEPATR